MDITGLLEWTFVKECPIPGDVTELLADGEEPVAAYKTFRDTAVFTTKRLVVRDAQGMTGRKVEVYSLPYDSIHMWSSEGAGLLDRDAEIQLWTKAGDVKIKLRKGIDIRRLDRLIANRVL